MTCCNGDGMEWDGGCTRWCGLWNLAMLQELDWLGPGLVKGQHLALHILLFEDGLKSTGDAIVLGPRSACIGVIREGKLEGIIILLLAG